MGDTPPQTGPDLHAIFGMDVAAEAAEDHVVEVERVLTADEDANEAIDIEIDGDRDGEREGSGPSPDTGPGAGSATPQPGEWTGITRPSRRGSSSRFLTDVIVDMGLASRGQVEEAVESSRGLGTTPERVLLDAGALTHDGLSRALAARYGLGRELFERTVDVLRIDMCFLEITPGPWAQPASGGAESADR